LKKFARSYITEAGNRIETAGRALKKRSYAYCVRQCQEAVELSLKASLRIKGVEYPKFHDVGDVLIEVKELYPSWFRKEIEKMAEVSKRLVEKREGSMYGFEESGLRPEDIATEEMARKDFEDAKFVYEKCEELIRTLK